MSLEYDLYHSSCYSAYAVVSIVVVIYSYCNQQWTVPEHFGLLQSYSG